MFITVIIAFISFVSSKLVTNEYPANPNLMPNIGNG